MELPKVQTGVSAAVCESPGLVSAAAFVRRTSRQPSAAAEQGKSSGGNSSCAVHRTSLCVKPELPELWECWRFSLLFHSSVSGVQNFP